MAGRTKRFGEIMKHVLPQMPHEMAEIPQFLDTVEKLYEIYEVPEDVRAKLLLPLLTKQAKSIVGRICRWQIWDDMQN